MHQAEQIRLRSRAAAFPRWTGGVAGNATLTGVVALVLLLLLAVEGATIPWIRPLLTVHVFVGMLLLGPVALKLASTGYRFARYYGGTRDYVAKGPPPTLMRLLVAPVLVASTVTLFATGVAVVALGQRGMLLGLHKASFVVWFGAMTIHVLAYTRRAAQHAFGRRLGGAGLRAALLVASLVAGLAVAIWSLPLAHSWSSHQGEGDQAGLSDR